MVAVVGRRGPVRVATATEVARLDANWPRGWPPVLHPVTACTPVVFRVRHRAVTPWLEAVSQLDLGSGQEMPTFNVEIE